MNFLHIYVKKQNFKSIQYLEFFETVVKFKNMNIKQVDSLALKKKMEDNLFF